MCKRLYFIAKKIKKMKLIFNIQSFSDIITNSSSELFLYY